MGFMGNYRAMRSAAQKAGYGKATSRAVRSMKSSGRSSGAAATKRLAGVQNYVKNNKAKSAMIGGAGVAGIGAMQNRRGRGVSKTSGRPTGMYGH